MHIGMQHHGLLIQAHGRVLRVILLLVEVQHIFHGRDKLPSDLRETPVFMLPRLEFVFFSSSWMVSGEIFVTKPNSTAFCASKRTVQWSCPSGEGLQATAIRWAVCKPESALRRCCCTLSCKTASSPPCANRRRTFVTVASHTSKAAASSAVLHPSADLRRMRARVRVRALALPRCTKLSKVVRSSSAKVMAGCCGMGHPPFSFSIPTR